MASARKPLSFANKPRYLKDDELMVAKEEGTANSVPAAAVIQRSQALFGFPLRPVNPNNAWDLCITAAAGTELAVPSSFATINALRVR